MKSKGIMRTRADAADDGWPMNFKTTVCMYINDSLQYLRAANTGKAADVMHTEFAPTDDEERIINGLQRVKSESMRAAGLRPLVRPNDGDECPTCGRDMLPDVRGEG